MILAISLLLTLLLVLSAIEDWKYRAIRIWYFPVIFVLCLGLAMGQVEWTFGLTHTLTNMAYSLIMIGVVWLYFRRRQKAFKEVFGWGDLIFYLAISPLFSPLNYVVFFTISLVVCLALHGVLFGRRFFKETVPLAGYLSLQLIPLVLLSYGWNIISLRIDNWLYF